MSGASTITPVALVNEMLDKLPLDIWNDSTKTFLDPACGTGIFILCCLERLNEGLKEEMPDDVERLTHIMTKQLWANDIDHKQIRRFKSSLKKLGLNKQGNIIYNNISNVNSLDHEWNMKFDVVVGNPPYNPSSNKNSGLSKGSGTKIWHKFIEVANSVTEPGSYISFITPSNWRLGKSNRLGNAQEIMWRNDIIDIFDASNRFGGTAVHMALDAWLMKKSPSNIDAVYAKYLYMPLMFDDNTKQFLKAKTDEACFTIDIKDNRHYAFDCIRKKAVGTSKYKYKHFNTVSQFRNGLYDWYSEKTVGFDSKKVLISSTSNLSVEGNFVAKYDSGETGCGHCTSAYSVENELEGIMLSHYLNTSETILNIIKESIGDSGYAIPFHLLKTIPKNLVKAHYKSTVK